MPEVFTFGVVAEKRRSECRRLARSSALKPFLTQLSRCRRQHQSTVMTVDERKTVMPKSNIRGKKRNLRCPVCRKPINDPADFRRLGLKKEYRLLPQPGDLTECDHCRAILEYGGDPASLTLQLAPKKRLELLNAISRQGPHDLSFPKLIAYVMRYRQMPVRPPIGYRFTKISKNGVVSDSD